MWKITKGTEQHFDGAPDWATHVYMGYGGGHYLFMSGDIYNEQSKYTTTRRLTKTWSVDRILSDRSEFELLAVRERQSELPTIGGKFELSACYYGEPKGTPITVIGHLRDAGHPDKIVVKVVTDTFRTVFELPPCYAQPVQSHRDKAIEALLKSVTHSNAHIVTKTVEQIYDAIVDGKVDGLGKVD